MFPYVTEMTLSEADQAYKRAIRNLSPEQVMGIENDPGKLDDVSPLFRYARRLLRRILELKKGIIYSETGDFTHTPV